LWRVASSEQQYHAISLHLNWRSVTQRSSISAAFIGSNAASPQRNPSASQHALAAAYQAS